MDVYKNLDEALAYLREVIRLRLEQHFNTKVSASGRELQFPIFEWTESQDAFTRFIAHCNLSLEEFVTLLLALAPHLEPHFFENIIGRYIPHDGDFPEFGGIKGTHYRYMIPTVETALFILAGNSLARRLELLHMFESQHVLMHNKILQVEEVRFGEPFSSSRLLIHPEYVELFTKGRISIPPLSMSFPAQPLQTDQEWADLVLPPETRDQLQEIEIWVRHHEAIMDRWGMAKKLKPGYRSLFHGPPGTGKTLAASLIGKYTGRPVFRVDLSKVVSKYIGETEKNLANFFDKAENKNWCIFFDEADACFGKRSSTKESKDRYANQEISYLLQRIEEYPGLVIMASNFKNNIDTAFIRRFNSIIYFPFPKESERLQIWEKAFPSQVKMDTQVNLDQLARDHELSGSNIINVVQYACLHAMNQGTHIINHDTILSGIRKEYLKENR